LSCLARWNQPNKAVISHGTQTRVNKHAKHVSHKGRDNQSEASSSHHAVLVWGRSSLRPHSWKNNSCHSHSQTNCNQ
jgi:hypothetical protein